MWWRRASSRAEVSVGFWLMLGILILSQGSVVNPATADDGETTSADQASPKQKKVQAQEQGDPKDQAKPKVSFITDHTTVWLGGTQLIPFKIGDKATKTRQLDGAITKGQTRLEIVRPAEVVKGYDLGFVRIRAKKTGDAVLRIGQATIKIAIKRRASHDRITTHRPRIVAPAPGAAVWGKIAMGVELFDPPSDYPGKPRNVRLVGPEGVTIKRLKATARKQGPTRIVSFAVDFSKRKPGPVALRAVAEHPTSKAMVSQPRVVTVVDPAKDRLIEGEAEAHQDLKRPQERYRQKSPRVKKDKKASGGQYVDQRGKRPVLLIPVTIKQTGWYQLMLRTQSDIGGVEWPCVSLAVDTERWGRTDSPIVGAKWTRNPIGKPVRLKKGEHLLAPRYRNDYRRGKKDDRNLRIDRYELLHLNGRPPLDNPERPDLVDLSEAEQSPAPDFARLHQALNSDDLIVAFKDNLDQASLSGDVTIEGMVAWPDKVRRPPTVTLEIDGKPLMAQRSADPEFRVSRASFKPGKVQTIQLVARQDNGQTAKSAPCRVTMAPIDERGGGATPKSRPYKRFMMTDSRWVKGVEGNLTKARRGHGDLVRKFASKGDVELNLPEDISGWYDLEIEARGQSYKGHPKAQVSLVTENGDKTHKIKKVEVRGYNRWRNVGRVQLPKGAKRLRIGFINDAYGGSKKKDRNMYLHSVSLRETLPKEKVPPTAEIVYPESESDVYGVDAVVTRVADNVKVRWIELMLDGKPTGVRVSVDDGLSRKLLPLILRQVSPGRHQVSVRVRDEAGNMGRAKPILLNVRSQAPSKPGRYKQAVRLLHRFGYGPQPRALADVLMMGVQAYMQSQLGHTLANPGEANAWARAVIPYPKDRSRYHVTRRTLEYLTTTPNPLRARLTMFVDNHFSTYIRKARAWREARDIATFIKLGPAPFGDLLHASSTSPAMLRFLDQHRNFKRHVNENYAREVMELHTLGVDAGYTQHDVVEMTHLLTGWSFVNHARPNGGGGRFLASSFRFIPHLNDKRARTVFGLHLSKAKPTERFDRIRLVLEMLGAHPSTARYISKKLAEHYVAAPPPAKLVDQLTRTYLESGGDLAAMLMTMAQSKYLRQNRIEPRLTHPLGYGVSLSRTGRGQSSGKIRNYLRKTGVGLFRRKTPDGYPPEDPAYADTNAMLQRWRYARQMDYRLFRTLPRPLWRAPKKTDKKKLARWRQRVVDHYAVNLTGYTLSDASNQAALRILKTSDEDWRIRLKIIAAFIAQLPETNLH